MKIHITNIYPKYIKVFTDIDPNVDIVFPVIKIDRENSEKFVSQDKFEVNQMRIQKYVFTSKDHCNVHQLFIVRLLHLLLPVIETIFFSVPRFTIRRKKNPQKLNVFFLDQNRRHFTPQKLPVIRYVDN